MAAGHAKAPLAWAANCGRPSRGSNQASRSLVAPAANKRAFEGGKRTRSDSSSGGDASAVLFALSPLNSWANPHSGSGRATQIGGREILRKQIKFEYHTQTRARARAHCASLCA